MTKNAILEFPLISGKMLLIHRVRRKGYVDALLAETVTDYWYLMMWFIDWRREATTLNNKRRYRGGYRNTFEKLVKRDGLICKMCGITDRALMSLDHIKSISLGGSRKAFSNLQILCKICNQKKENNLCTQ